MQLHRRDFMKVLGISVATLVVNRACIGGCYAPAPMPTVSPVATGDPVARERLRRYWLGFEELAKRSREDAENKFGQELVSGHLAALDELVANGEVPAPVAELVHESYDAAVYHVWRSNVNITCYEPVLVDYAPSSAGVLVEQAEVLNQLAEEGTIDPATLAKARAALEHDLSFYALTDEEVDTLYSQLLSDNQQTGTPIPSFEALTLDLTPQAREATQFIIDLLTGK